MLFLIAISLFAMQVVIKDDKVVFVYDMRQKEVADHNAKITTTTLINDIPKPEKWEIMLSTMIPVPHRYNIHDFYTDDYIEKMVEHENKKDNKDTHKINSLNYIKKNKGK